MTRRRSPARSAELPVAVVLLVALGPACIMPALLGPAPDGTSGAAADDGPAMDASSDPADGEPAPGGFDLGPGDPEGTSGGPIPDPEVPNRGDCCVAGRGVGCVDPAIEACVCAVDPKCCTDGWDRLCADHVEVLGCGGCSIEPLDDATDCCTAHMRPACGDPQIAECVCAMDPYCCDIAWDQVCVDRLDEAACGQCGAPEDQADCCAPTDAAGCADPAVAECVCALDSYCCEMQWDELCVDEAAGYCDGCGVDGSEGAGTSTGGTSSSSGSASY